MCACVGRSGLHPRDPSACGYPRTLNIGHLTDVSQCKLHQYLCCNHEIKCQHWPRPGLAAQSDMALPGPAHTLVRKQMDTMAPTHPAELQESTSPAKLQKQACPTGLQKPIRPTALQKRCVSLTAAPTAPCIARGQVQATIAAWDIPVDTSVAILLTSELVTNAVMHEAGETINLVITYGYGQLGVDVHDTSCELPVPVDGPPDAETGRGLVLVASLSSSWGYYRTPTGKAVYFTLALADGSGEDETPEE